MKAAVLFETGQPLRCIEIDRLPELQSGQVLVDIIYSGLCHSQVMEVRGCRGEDKYLPHMLGHEGVGLVREVGPNVNKVAAGDAVIMGWIKGDGLDAPGGVYDYQGSTINSGAMTTFAEASIVAENRLVKLPQGLPADIAVLFGCALPTGAGIVMNEIDPPPGATFAVFGLGGIGLSALIALNLYNPARVIAIDVEDEKLVLARELGATDTINMNVDDPLAAINRLVPGGVDYAIEAAGKTSVIEQAFLAVKDAGGLCVFASHPPEGEKICLDPLTMHKGKQIRGSWGGAAQPDRDIPKLAELYQRHQLPLAKILSRTYRLDQINEAVTDLEARKINRALIDINSSLLASKSV